MSFEFPDPATTASLSHEEIAHVVSLLCNADVQEQRKTDFLTLLNQRGESAGELAGFAAELLKQAVSPMIERDEGRPLVELCGTGGDKTGLLNISTAAMFVAAGAGARVVKHGNRAVSSQCGSADVLEALGVNLHLEIPRIAAILEQAGCVFLLASDFHPAVALIAPVRRALAARGQMTIFNFLGPLLNPALPEFQLTGVYRRDMLFRYAEAMGMLGRRKAWAVHGQPPAALRSEGGGIDELTVTGHSWIVETSKGVLKDFRIDPLDLGFSLADSYAELQGGGAVENARRIIAILSGKEKGFARDMIVLNAAAALYLGKNITSLLDAVALANESIDSGKALRALERLKEASSVEL